MNTSRIRIILIRHGQSEGNTRSPDERARLRVSNLRLPLTQKGERQASALGVYLREAFPESCREVYSSYYTRAKQSAAFALPGVLIREDARIAEKQNGIWQTMTEVELRSNFPHEIERAEKEGWYAYRPLGGENEPDVELRATSFLEMVERRYRIGRIRYPLLVFTHEQFTRIAMRFVDGSSIAESQALFEKNAFPNCSLTIFEQVDHELRCLMYGFVPPEVAAVE